MKTTSRKGIAVQDLATIGMTMVIVGAMIAIGVWVLTDFQEADGVFGGTARTALTLAIPNGTATALPYRYIRSIDGIYNTTMSAAGEELGSGNYTLVQPNSVLISIDADDVTVATTEDWLVNYTVYDDEGYLAAANATSGMSQLASWLPIIAIVIAAAIIIGTLTMWASGRSL